MDRRDMTQTHTDSLNFFRAWIADPRGIGAVAPSGRALAELITGDISEATGPVIELGPGTGVFTQALLDRGAREEDLTLVEFGADFARLLRARFPEARVLCMDAGRLGQHRLFEGAPVGAVISGLPLLTMSPRRVMAILDGAFSYMQPRGAFYQFTYGPRCPVPRAILERLGLKATLLGRAIRNIPPAAVYRISARPARQSRHGAGRSE
jgi:phosphatidylethanolamine/phosphatidyl-N-methylethanolamine N-methyltransferase